MEFSVQRVDLLKELTLSQGVIERKTTIPILSNILLDASGESLRMTATDLELGIRSSCAAKVKKPGSTTAPAKKLFDYVRQLEDPEIKFKTVESASGSALQVTCGHSHVRMAGMPKENFPVLPDMPTKLAAIPPSVLAQMIRRTVFAISNEESRYTLNAGLLILKPETMTMVATDGHRLAHVETEPDGKESYSGVSGELRVLVPKKAMTELARLLADVEEGSSIEFAKDDNHLFFQIGPRLLISRMLSGQFPNYEAVMPKGNDRKVALPVEALTAAVRRVSLFSDERSHAIRLQLNKDEVKISSTGSDAGEGAEDMLEASYDGTPLQMGFNWQYLIDFLGAAGAENVTFEFKDEQSAGQLRPESEDKLRYRYVVMPMRI
jgi:DNA polymerase-3 subunit beta